MFESAGRRIAVIYTFLAVPELAKLRQLIAIQGERLGEIELAKRPPEEESESGETAEPESVGFTAGHSEVETTEATREGNPTVAKTASLEVEVDPSEALTMEVGELAHKANEPLTFAPPDEPEEAAPRKGGGPHVWEGEGRRKPTAEVPKDFDDL